MRDSVRDRMCDGMCDSMRVPCVIVCIIIFLGLALINYHAQKSRAHRVIFR